jgi:hypothetical protein
LAIFIVEKTTTKKTQKLRKLRILMVIFIKKITFMFVKNLIISKDCELISLLYPVYYLLTNKERITEKFNQEMQNYIKKSKNND